jgi:predicted metal-dependent hydrolase
MESIEVGNLRFAVIRSPRRSSVEIGVERDGSLVLRAPTGVAIARLERFATEKRMWVREKLSRKEAVSAPQSRPREFVSGEGFPYLGRSYRLLLVARQERPLMLADGRFRLLRKEKARGREHFTAWYTNHAKRWLDRRVRKWAPRLGVKEVRVDVLDLGYRWGSCGRGRLNFNQTTIALPPTIIDYVIVHELVHLRHAHHGASFWSAVARAMPDYETRRRWLAECGAEYGL